MMTGRFKLMNCYQQRQREKYGVRKKREGEKVAFNDLYYSFIDNEQKALFTPMKIYIVIHSFINYQP